MSQRATTSTEKIDVDSGHLVEKVKELVHEGNVRRIIIKDSDGKAVVEVMPDGTFEGRSAIRDRLAKELDVRGGGRCQR